MHLLLALHTQCWFWSWSYAVLQPQVSALGKWRRGGIFARRVLLGYCRFANLDRRNFCEICGRCFVCVSYKNLSNFPCLLTSIVYAHWVDRYSRLFVAGWGNQLRGAVSGFNQNFFASINISCVRTVSPEHEVRMGAWNAKLAHICGRARARDRNLIDDRTGWTCRILFIAHFISAHCPTPPPPLAAAPAQPTAATAATAAVMNARPCITVSL